MVNSLFNGENPIGKHLNIALTSSSYKDDDNRYNLAFENDKLLIVGYIENDKNILYQNEYWSLLYFQCQLGISNFELLPIGMSMEIEDKTNSQEVIKSLEKEFPYYSFFNPMEDIEKQADNLCFYMKIILFVLSIATLLIAICLISICNYLHVIEIKKDIGLIQCIGITKKESTKMLYFHSLFVAITGAITSIIELILFYFMMKLGLSAMFNLPAQFSFNVVPYIFVLILSIVVGVIPAYFTSYKLYNLDPLTALKG